MIRNVLKTLLKRTVKRNQTIHKPSCLNYEKGLIIGEAIDLFPEKLWNLPVKEFEDRGKVLADIITAYNFQKKKLSFLEIGVYKANTSEKLFKHLNKQLNDYLGIDPYLGTEQDAYFSSYWQKNKNIAEETYISAKEIFDQYGYTLLRKTSDDFFSENTKQHDVIFVDGDHRYEFALKDFKNAFKSLKPGGLLLMDDYGNSDTPQVVPAINRFIQEYHDQIKNIGFRPLWFQNANKHIPIQLSFVYMVKK